MSFETKRLVDKSTIKLMELVAEEKLHKKIDENYSFWEPKTANDFLMRDGAIHFARDILSLEGFKYE